MMCLFMRLPLCFWCCSALVNSAQVPRAVTTRSLDADDVPDEVVMELFGPAVEDDVDMSEVATAEDGTQLSPVPFQCGSDYLLVFSLPKTGTTSFDYSMKSLCGFGGENYMPVMQHKYPRNIKAHDVDVDVAKDFLDKVPRGKTVFVVVMTRNPWERVISSFFQVHGVKVKSFEEATTLFNKCCVGSVAQREKGFWRLLTMISGAHWSNIFRSWRDHVSNSTGHLAHVGNWKHDRRVQVVVLREEDISRWPGILAGRVFPGFKLVTGNVGNEKEYAKLYEIFKRRYRYAPRWIEAFKQSPALDLYTPSEVAKMVSAARKR